MSIQADFAAGIAESIAGEIWDTPITQAADGMLELIESRLAAQARATGNAHSVTGTHTMGRIENHG